jgi:hypothetical protein
MLSHDELVVLEQALRDRTVLSVYVNGDVTDVAARSRWRTELRNRFDEIAESLGGAGHAEREAYSAARERALDELESFTPGHDAPGWMGFFSDGEVHHAGVIGVPVPTAATWGKGANVAAGLRALKESRAVLVVVADSTQVRIHRYVDRKLELAEEFEREAHVDQPYHMDRPLPQGFRSGTRGLAGTDAAQREQRNATDVMLAEAVSRVESMANNDAWVLVGGIPTVAADLRGRLSKRVQDRASVVPIDVHLSEAGLADVAREHASRLRSANDLARIEQVVSASAAGGTGAVGTEDIDRALQNGQVHELYLTSSYVADHGSEAADVIRKAFDEGATIEHVSGSAAERLDAIGGIAARLRFTLNAAGSNAVNP